MPLQTTMKLWVRYSLIIICLSAMAVLSGCPGLGGGGSNAQQQLPGELPPPGLQSGGVRTVLGATITPPDGQTLQVKYVVSYFPNFYFSDSSASLLEAYRSNREPKIRIRPMEETPWVSVRRVTMSENAILFEGLNFDGLVTTAAGVKQTMEIDTNRMLPLGNIYSLQWRYVGQAK